MSKKAKDGRIFHGKDLTYSFVSGCRWHTVFPSLRGSYRVFHEIAGQSRPGEEALKAPLIAWKR